MAIKLFETSVQPANQGNVAFLISTGAIDRDNDSIDPNGWDLDNYKKSPVVLFAHDYTQPPVAKAVSIGVTPQGLRAEVEFPPRGLYPFADVVHDMVKSGFLSATSVGFKPLEAHPNRKGGHTITRAELLEFSIVSVPANPGCLIQRGANKAAINKWFNNTGVEVDLEAVGRSGDQIDLSNLEFPEPIEGITVTEGMVEQILERMKPALVAGLKAGVKLQAERAAHEVFCRMTGRLD